MADLQNPEMLLVQLMLAHFALKRHLLRASLYRKQLAGAI
jgi:hypothetical protein